jgi:hypothetical protein
MSGPTIDLIPAAAAAALVQPHLPGHDASLWLTDLRRARPAYRSRLTRPPAWVRRGGRVLYGLADLHRVVAELGVAVAEPHEIIKSVTACLPDGTDTIEI